MRSNRLLAVLLAVSIAILAVVLLNRPSEQVAEQTTEPTATPTALASPIAAPTETPTFSPTPTPSGSQVALPASNPNPDLSVDANGLSKATVVMTTNQGVIKYKFYPQDAPGTVKRIIELINGGFYNGLTFHRVVPGFVVQGGDPIGNGTGGSGVKLKAEFNSRRHIEGAVAMARAAHPDSADSQFYISLGTHPHLDKNYTVFGQVVEGMDVARKLQVGDRMVNVRVE